MKLRCVTTCLLWSLASLWPVSLEAASETSVDVSVNRTEVSVGGRLRYTVEASVQGSDSISLERKPSFGSAFRVVGRRRSPQFVIRNGRAHRSVTVGYRLRAVEPGEHTIRPPVVRIGSRRIEAEPRTVTVTSGGNRGRNDRRGNRGNRGDDSKRRDDLFLKGRIEPTRTPYVGQQLVLSYYLYKTPHKFDIEPRPPEEPSLDDFWIEGLSRKFAGQRQMVNTKGGLMERTTMRAYAIFPLKTGTLTIEPMKVDVVSGGFFANRNKVELQSKPISLDVRPLPSGAPDAFQSGNIGDWHFSAEVDRLSTSVGRGVTLTLEASGYGNLRRLTLPDVPEEGNGFAVTSRESETSKQIKGGRLWGRKKVDYTIVPTREGTVEIPSVTFAYFAPADESYHTQRSQSFDLRVSGGRLSARQKARLRGNDDQAKQSKDSENEQQASEALEDRLHGPIRDLDPTPRSPLPMASSTTLYWWLVALPGVGCLLLLLGPGLWRRLHARTSDDSEQAARRRADEHLDRALEADPDEAPEAVLRALETYLTAALDCPGGEWTKAELESWLQAADVSEEHAATCLELLEWCQEARFAPAAALEAEELERAVERCRSVIDRLESARESGAIHPIETAIVVGVVSLASLGMPATVEAQEAGSFADQAERALSAQKAGDWKTAARRWGRLAEAHPSHAVVRYNYGTVLLHRGDLGRGRLALERAVLSEARLSRARDNLEIARRLVQRRRVERARGQASIPAPPSSLQWWDRATRLPPRWLSWGLLVGLWLASLGAGVRLLVDGRGRRWATGVMAVALVVALGSGGLWWGRSLLLARATPAIVTADDVELRSGPSEHASAREIALPIVAGVRVDLLERREDWSKVRVSERHAGWVSTDVLTQVVPREQSSAE